MLEVLGLGTEEHYGNFWDREFARAAKVSANFGTKVEVQYTEKGVCKYCSKTREVCEATNDCAVRRFRNERAESAPLGGY
jgi:hypothetical protein